MGDYSTSSNGGAPNLMQRVFSLFKSVRPGFDLTSIQAEPKGKRILNLLNHGESYVLNSPKLSIKFFPVANVEWVVTVRVKCAEYGLNAENIFKGSSFFTRKENQKMIRGKIFESSSLKTICEINGHWDRTVTKKTVTNGKQTIIYDANESITGLKTPIVLHPEEVTESESACVWGKVSRGIKGKEWEKAKEAKRNIEDNERELAKEKKRRDLESKTLHINFQQGKWRECSPQQKWVPSAPIIFPTQVSTQLLGNTSVSDRKCGC